MKFFLFALIFVGYCFLPLQTLKCYDCLRCPYPWSTVGVATFGSLVSFASNVKSCYKKEFYSAHDRRLDHVSRGALDGECRAGKFENAQERSITYCCYSNYCNGNERIHRGLNYEILLFYLWVIVTV